MSSLYLFLEHLLSKNLDYALSTSNINALTRINVKNEFGHSLEVFRLHPALSNPDNLGTAIEKVHATHLVLGKMGIDSIEGRNWPRISLEESPLVLVTHKSLEDEQEGIVYACSLRESRERNKRKTSQPIPGIGKLVSDIFDCYDSIPYNYGTSLIAYATPRVARELGIVQDI